MANINEIAMEHGFSALELAMHCLISVLPPAAFSSGFKHPLDSARNNTFSTTTVHLLLTHIVVWEHHSFIHSFNRE